MRCCVCSVGNSCYVRRVKNCGKCRVTKPLSEFHASRRSGHQHWCKSCRREYDAAYWQRTRERRLEKRRQRHAQMAEWNRQLKTQTPCADCGGVFHHAAMTWDHLPGNTKRADVSNLLRRRYSRAVISEEMAKCEVVCANCHAVRTFERRGVAQPGQSIAFGTRRSAGSNPAA